VRPYLKKPFTKIGLVKWLKVKALNSSPSPGTTKEKKFFGHPASNVSPYGYSTNTQVSKEQGYFNS
jgi:hypothetical protein